MIYFQSKYLAEKFNINLAKWKRWSREFLPPDPLGGLRTGYARQFSYKEAFCVFLAGYLVSALKFSVPEAKQILSDLDGWLKKQGFFSLPNHPNRARTTVFNHIYIFQLSGATFGYAIQTSNHANPFQIGDDQATSLDLTLLGSSEDPFDQDSLFGARLLLINTLYHSFLDRLAS